MKSRRMRQLSFALIGAFGAVYAYGILTDDKDLSRLGSSVARGGAKIIRLTNSTSCHPSYSGRCVPNYVSDVDCASGDGNGPNFVSGPLRVVGPDVYGLDRDGDGRACEPLAR